MNDKPKSPFQELAKQASLQPQEQLLELKKGNLKLSIGVPKEITYQENRVPLTPSSVNLLVNNGHEIAIESGAGKNANFLDKQYSEAGAKIVYSKVEIYKAEIILKIDPPTKEEIDLMFPGQYLFSAIQMTNLSETYIKQLVNKKVTAIAYEFLKDQDDTLSIIRSMSEIAGSSAVLIGAEYLSNTRGGKGELLGGISGIPPTEVVIIGAGTVGEYAARTAVGLGANVKVFDNSLAKLRRLQNNLGMRVFTSILQPNIMSKALAAADLAIGALRSDEGRSPSVVSEDMVRNMKSGSVIVDVSIDQGGVFETSEITTHTNPTFTKHDVIHYCVPNIPSRVARTASYALSNIFSPIMLDIAEVGGFKNYFWESSIIRNGVYVYKGNLVKRHIGERFNMKFKDIDLLIGAHL
ncbi:MAG: alanine dehydrogenase [Bacteroidetes bacterium]|nr:MAG: alanine dehydrogenase [Bacteroidota bacterium]